MIETLKDTPNIYEVSNGFIQLKFYKKGDNKGKFDIRFLKDEIEECTIKNCYSVINYLSHDKDRIIECASINYSFESKTDKIVNSIGNGLKIIFKSIGNINQEITFNIQIILFEHKDFLLIKLIDIKDNNSNQLAVHSISPFTVKNSYLWLSGIEQPTNLQSISWFKNGWQSWSSCELFFGNQRDTEGSSTEILNMIYDNQDYIIKGRFYSEYCTVITDLNSYNSLVLGFVSLKDQFSRIIIDYNDNKKLKLLTAFGCMDNVKFNKSSIDSSEELFIGFKLENKGYIGLIDYAKIVNLKVKGSLISKIPTGWSSWYYYFTNITQNHMIKNLEFFNEHRDIPIDFFQLDDGYFTKIGDFSSINEKFPKGLPWLFKYIKKLGFKGGIWTAPFIAIKRSNFFKTHKNWFLTKNNKFLPVLFNWKSFEYSLDLSNEEILDYLHNYFRDLINGFELKSNNEKEQLIDFFKIDFLHAGTPYSASYNNPNYTRAQILYNGIKTIREAISDDAFLLGCGAPLGPCVGLVNAMRISCDTAPLWDAGYIEEFENGKGINEISLKAALLNTLYRSFMHKYFWINDPDCLMIRRTDTKLNLDEIRLQLTIFGLSGGEILISDDMTKLSREEINDAKLVTPPYNPKGYDPIVMDAFISKYPSIYTLETEEVIGKRYLVSYINWNDNKTSERLKISEIIPHSLEVEKYFIIYDFWNEKYLGEFKSTDFIDIKDLEPHSCRYLNLIPITKKLLKFPILISTNLHLTQGCCEIKNYRFNEELSQLNIVLELKGEREGYLILKLPQNKKLMKSGIEHAVIDSKENLWRIYVRFKDHFSLNVEIN